MLKKIVIIIFTTFTIKNRVLGLKPKCFNTLARYLPMPSSDMRTGAFRIFAAVEYIPSPPSNF